MICIASEFVTELTSAPGTLSKITRLLQTDNAIISILQPNTHVGLIDKTQQNKPNMATIHLHVTAQETKIYLHIMTRIFKKIKRC